MPGTLTAIGNGVRPVRAKGAEARYRSDEGDKGGWRSPMIQMKMADATTAPDGS